MDDVLENQIGLSIDKDATKDGQFVAVGQIAPKAPRPEQLLEVPGINESLRVGQYSSRYSEMKYHVEARDEKNVHRVMDRWRETLLEVSNCLCKRLFVEAAGC